MKKIFFITTIALLFNLTVFGQQKGNGLPNVELKTLDGQTVFTGDISNDGKPIVISFWATWCSPCKRELNNINDVYEDWVDETGVRVIAVSIDDSRQVYKVAPYVMGKAWEFDVLLDTNGDFKRAMNVNNVPFTILLDGNGNVVHQSNNYAEGDEEELYDLILKLVE